ncbi:hypothetical protein RAS2_03210 [Phycisphaerae bacterium RAS2]|nr:hypothetical protein RAS2_03210 [Phycisphaerae bacterium RAS2]
MLLGAGDGNDVVIATATNGSSKIISWVELITTTGLSLKLPRGSGTFAQTMDPCAKPSEFSTVVNQRQE